MFLRGQTWNPAQNRSVKITFSQENPIPLTLPLRTDPETVRKETEETVKAALKYGCPTEFVLKDISTVSNRPENLIIWANTVSDVLDQYYEE